MNRVSNIDEIMSDMTLEEKARLVNGATFFGSAGIDRLGIPRLQLLDGGTGINFEQLFGDMTEFYGWSDANVGVDENVDDKVKTENLIGSTKLCHVIEYFFESDKLKDDEIPLYDWIKSKLYDRLNGNNYSPGCFPPGILLGATWNPNVVNKVGEALGMESRLFGIDILLGSPNINIHRDPLNGRLFEGYSEDPFLVTKLAPELVKGVQKYGVAANVKHFAANNQETNRVGINEIISERAMEEIYLPGFKACVRGGGVKTVMSAYNKINGIPCTENRSMLVDKLRSDWGFNGMVVSDWGAVSNPVAALDAGNDLTMPGPHEWGSIAEGVESGSLSMDSLNTSVRRILELIYWFDENREIKDFGKNLDELKVFTDRAAYDAACEGAVLLKNDEILPIKQSTKVYITGSGAHGLIESGSGSAGINTDRTGSIYDYLVMYLGKDNVNIGLPDTDESSVGSIVLCVCSLGGMEGNDRKDLKLLSEDLKLISEISQPAVVILNTCGPVDLGFTENQNIRAIIAAFLPGMEGSHALADILTGRVNPSGKLPVTFPVRYEDTPTCINFPGDGYEVNYGEGIFIGYRYYDKKKVKPMYAFGYGLSYTDFSCKLISVDVCLKNNSSLNGFGVEESTAIRIDVEVINIGDKDGSEVVQIYVGDPYSTLSKPVKELKDFHKIHLKVGESENITFDLKCSDLASYDSYLGCWTVEEGFYDIYAAVSSREEDIFGSERVYIDVKSPYSYSVDSSVKIICEDPILKTLAYELWSRQGWDTSIIDNNYQYTSGKSLRSIMADISSMQINDDSKKEFIRIFNEGAANIKKN